MVKEYYKAKGYEARKSFGYLIRRASHMLTAELEKICLKNHVTFVQWVILMNLRDGLADTSAGLCNNIRYDSGALTRVIDQMEEKGLITRNRSDEDRRMVSLALTKEGRKLVESLLPSIVDTYNLWFGDFSKDEADTLIKLLMKLISNIEKTTKSKEQ